MRNGCDLENVDPLGTATINVVAKYPYQPVTAPSMAADPVVFTIHHQFKKTLTVFSKGQDKNGVTSNSVAKIVLAHAQDIDGSPLAYELVCWMADNNAEGPGFAGDLPMPTADDPTATINLDPWHALLTTYQDPWGMNRLCTFTDRWGDAHRGHNSNRTSVNVIAEFVNEGRPPTRSRILGRLGRRYDRDGTRHARADADAAQPLLLAVTATCP